LHSIRKFTGNYSEQGEQIYQDGDVLFDSIYRFKGQEAPAVILCDISPDKDNRKRWEKLLFCGMTRPTLRLEMLVDKSTSWFKTLQKASSQ
jgi:superfamily I DNA and RNA helicase